MMEIIVEKRKIVAWELIIMFLSGTAGLVTLGKQFGLFSFGMPLPIENVMMQPGGIFFALLILVLLFILIKSIKIEK